MNESLEETQQEDQLELDENQNDEGINNSWLIRKVYDNKALWFMSGDSYRQRNMKGGIWLDFEKECGIPGKI